MLYDLASLTKILVSVPLMLIEFDKNEQTSKILTKLDKTYKNNIKAREKAN